jgi:octaprenyl-diphosphate synthase
LNYNASMTSLGSSPVQVAFLRRVEAVITEALAGEDTLSSAGRFLALAPGARRARSLLCQLLADVVAVPVDAAVVSAAVVELVHAASLLHDDVVDESPLRRGRPTANATHGNAVAVLSGDLVLVRALRLLSAPAQLSATLGVVETMTAAALFELRARGDVDVPLASWFSMAAGKTGALFGLCGRLCGLAAHDDERARRLERAFVELGVAFQIADDVGDLVGLAGKPALTDLREQNPSFPLLVALEDDVALRNRVRRLWSGDVDDATAHGERAAIAAAVLHGGAVDRAIDEAQARVHHAARVLGPDAEPLRPALSWAFSLVGATAPGDRRGAA